MTEHQHKIGKQIGWGGVEAYTNHDRGKTEKKNVPGFNVFFLYAFAPYKCVKFQTAISDQTAQFLVE